MTRSSLMLAGLALVGTLATGARAQEPRPTRVIRPPAAQVRPEALRPDLRPLRISPSAYVNLSELHFRPLAVAAHADGADPEAGLEAMRNGDPDYAPPPSPPRRFTPGGRTLLWNTVAGRSAFGDRLQLGAPVTTPSIRPGVQPLQPADPPPRPRLRPGRVPGGGGPASDLEVHGGAAACVQPSVSLTDSDCCSFTLSDEVAGQDVSYYNPSAPEAYFATAADAEAFAASIRASMPLFLPFHDGDVVLGQGWVYGSGAFHGSVDYQKKSSALGLGIDPAFEVRAAGDGKVVTVEWSDWLGNVVLIEHKAPNGDRYRSVYMHLRNGYDNDLANAQAMTVSETDKQEDEDGNYGRKYKYFLYANKSTHSQQEWGTNAQTIKVKPGDTVHAGQLIAYSGNTGYGGAGWGLDNNGDANDPNWANNHLHFQVTAPFPGTSDWVFVDAYGVYEKADSGCYDLLDETDYVRLLAPFYPSFHNVPVDYVTNYWGYYTGMGMALQTVSVHRSGSAVLASGSFQSGLPNTWFARLYMTGSDYQHWFNTYDQMGFRPREIQVARDGGGAPRFTVIWKKRSGEGYVAHHNLTDTDWNAKWQEYVVNGKMRVEDRAAYQVGGQRLWAAVFVKDGSPGFYELHYMPSDTFNARFAKYYDEGFRLWSVDPEELSGGIRYGAIWRPMPGTWPARHGLTPAEYQAEFLKYAGQGYRLHRVRGYADSGRFAAIWRKP
ncbi:MAG: hypothetical protein ACREK5_02815 [Gemmatimonadota bacterium]